MNEGQDPSIAERTQDESKIKRYVRYGAIAFFLVFFVAVIVSAVVRKFSG